MKPRNTKTARNNAIIAIHKENDLTYQQIADMFNISRQRVHQILRRAYELSEV